MRLIENFSQYTFTALILLYGSGVWGASQTTVAANWDPLRELSLDELRRANTESESPRKQLLLALGLVDDNATAASTYLSGALLSAEAGSDEALLAGMLQCSFAELLGKSRSERECTERGAAITSIEHPFPAALGQVHFGIWSAVNGRYEQAFQANRAAEQLAISAGYASLAVTTQNNQGIDYLMRGLPVLALRKFQASLELLRATDEAENQSLLTMLTSNIASAHLELGDFESADALLQVLVAGDEYDPNNPVNLVDEVILARASLALDRVEEGYERLSGVLQAIGPYGVTGDRAYAYSVLAQLQIALDNVNDGIESFKQAKEFAESSGDSLRKSKVDLDFAQALIDLGRYAEAETIIETNVATHAELGPSMIHAQALDLRAELLQRKGLRRLANAAKRQARQIQLQVAGAERDLELITLGESLTLTTQAYELAAERQKTRETEDRAQHDLYLRNTLIVITLLLSFITYLGVSRRYERRVAKAIQEVNAELEAKVSERTAALELEMAERLNAESERQSLAQNLAESEKLQALGQLTSGVAHDFNNLMTVVTLSAGQLRDVAQIASSQSVHDVDNILSAVESASKITGSLLAYARKQPLAPQPTDLKPFLLQSMPLFESTLGNGMSLEVDIEPCSVLVDRGQLTTAIINLLSNAKEASNRRGRVILRVGEVARDSELGVPTHWVIISVADQGEGMSPGELRRATEPFFTTKAVGHGTGLGLSMVDGFAKQTGGFLQIDSKKGEGTVVALHIPPCVEASEKRGGAMHKIRQVPPESLVIVVDDQRAIRDVLCRLLEQMGLETRSASSGAEALRLLERSKTPDLLITDLMMPGEISGQQLVNEVRERYADLPMLMMSGYTNSVELDVEFLHKPFTFDALCSAITRAIAQPRTAA